MNVHRLLITGTGRTFVQDAPGADVHCQYGIVKAEDIDGAEDGDVIKSAQGEELVVISPQFVDKYKRIKRDAQIITFKDAGIILATAGLTKESTVLEAGAGSGALTVLLAQHCGHVTTCDIDSHNLSVAKENVDSFGLDNVEFLHHDITTGIPRQADCLILDMPEPWHVLKHVEALKPGAYIVTYTPSTTQLQQVQEAAQEAGLLATRCVEVTERHWMVKGQAIRPTSRNVAFTAFLSFFRYLGPNWKDLRPQKPEPTPAWTLPDEEAMQAAFDQEATSPGIQEEQPRETQNE